MANLTMEELLDEIRACVDEEQIASYDGFIAIQVTLTKEPFGMFYIEVKDHHVSVAPYDYYDRNAAVEIAPDDFLNIIHRRLDPVIAYTTGKLKLDGDPGKVLELIKFCKPQKAKKKK